MWVKVKDIDERNKTSSLICVVLKVVKLFLTTQFDLLKFLWRMLQHGLVMACQYESLWLFGAEAISLGRNFRNCSVVFSMQIFFWSTSMFYLLRKNWLFFKLTTRTIKTITATFISQSCLLKWFCINNCHRISVLKIYSQKYRHEYIIATKNFVLSKREYSLRSNKSVRTLLTMEQIVWYSSNCFQFSKKQ